jgi:ankyrin repeat protein
MRVSLSIYSIFPSNGKSSMDLVDAIKEGRYWYIYGVLRDSDSLYEDTLMLKPSTSTTSTPSPPFSTLLLTAVESRQLLIVHMILLLMRENMSDDELISIVDYIGGENDTTALNVAITNNDAEIVDVLLLYGAYVSDDDLIASVENAPVSDISIIDMVVSAMLISRDGSISPHIASTMAHTAVYNDRDDILSYLIRRGITRLYDDEDASGNDMGLSLLIEAIDSDSPKCVHLLLEDGVDPNLPVYYEDDIVVDTHYDSDYSRYDIYDEQYTYITYPILEAVKLPRPSYDIVKDLLAHGADPNVRSSSGNSGDSGGSTTPLMIAAINGDEDIVRLLLRYGANVPSPSHPSSDILDNSNISPHILSIIRRHENTLYSSVPTDIPSDINIV